MPLKHRGRLGVHIHLNVGVAHVNPNHLRVCASDCFNRNTVVLLLIDNFDAVRDARRRVDEVERCIKYMEDNVQGDDYLETFEGFKPYELLKIKRDLAIMKEQHH